MHTGTQVADLILLLRRERTCRELKEIAGSLDVCYLVAFYERIEELYFPYFTESIHTEYQALHNSVFTANSVLRSLMPAAEVQTVLRRFIMRCLSGELHASQALGLYLGREDFWPVSVDEEKQEQVLEVVMKVPIAVTLQLYKALDS